MQGSMGCVAAGTGVMAPVISKEPNVCNNRDDRGHAHMENESRSNAEHVLEILVVHIHTVKT